MYLLGVKPWLSSKWVAPNISRMEEKTHSDVEEPRSEQLAEVPLQHDVSPSNGSKTS
jgi:hypothetical protein